MRPTVTISPLEILRLWRRAFRVVLPYLPLIAPLWLLAVVASVITLIPMQFQSGLIAFVAQPHGRNPLGLWSEVPLEINLAGPRVRAQFPLVAVAVLYALLSVLVVPLLSFGVEYAAQALKSRIARRLQLRILDRYFRDAASGLPFSSAEVMIAIQSYAGVVTGVFVTRIREWLQLAITTAGALVVLMHASHTVALCVVLWGVFFSFVLPNVPRARRTVVAPAGARPADSGAAPDSGPLAGPSGDSAATPIGPTRMARPDRQDGLLLQRGQLAEQQQQQGLEWQKLLTDVTSGMTTIVSLGLERSFRDEMESLLDERDRLMLRSLRLNQIGQSVTQISGVAGVGALIFGILTQRPVKSVVDLFNFSNKLVESLQRVEGGFGLEVESAVVLRRALATLEQLEQSAPGCELAEPPAVTFDRVDVDVTHGEGTKRLLQGVTFSVPAGALVCVYGQTGSGKSTLLEVLCGRLPIAGGTVTVGPHRFGPGDRVGVLKSMAVIDQFSALFRGTVRSNILRGCNNPAMPLAEAIEQACFDREPARREEILDRMLDPTSTARLPIAGGERKRVALARALVRALPALVVIDEVDSGLDEATAERVLANVRRWAAGRATAFVVSHQPGRVHCDAALHVVDGRIELERGWQVGGRGRQEGEGG